MSRVRELLIFQTVLAGFLASGTYLHAADDFSREAAAQALEQAVTFYHQQVAERGGYVWRYSADLVHREGEREVDSETAWVQPPGTPSVGDAYLNAYLLTGKPTYLEAARATAMALVEGQLQSGGWDYRIEFGSDGRDRYAYRRGNSARAKANTTTLDDDTTQAALRFLMRVDEALKFQDDAIHEAAQYALTALLQAQYPNGAWPQRYSEFPSPSQYPVKPASYPHQWSRTHPDTKYFDYYTLNDSTLADMIDTMFLAADVYDEPRYEAAAKRAGDFLLLAQMPEPQPAWAQQYDRDMQPAWARRFEPPAITGSESQGAIQILIRLYRRTGDRRYLDAVPAALAYLKKSELPDGRLARFYELRTNRPLFFTREYVLTYASDDLPTHYAFIVSSKVARLQQDYQRALQRGPDKKQSRKLGQIPWSKQLEAEARRIVEQLDERGAWVEEGYLSTVDRKEQSGQIINSRTFAQNVELLARYVTAERSER